MNTNKHPNKRKISMRNTPRRNLSLASTLCVDTQPRNKVQYRHGISPKYYQKMKRLKQTNKKLISKIRCMSTKSNSLNDIKIKYLDLKNRVLETEEQLLKDGVDTTRYSAFQMDDEDRVTQTDINNDKDFKFEVLLECEFASKDGFPIESESTQLDLSKFIKQEHECKNTTSGNESDS